MNEQSPADGAASDNINAEFLSMLRDDAPDGFGDGLYGSANLVGPDLGCVDTDRHIAHASTCSISIKLT